MDVKLGCLATLMLFTGAINTIATKYQDESVVGHLKHGQPVTFKHPAVQSGLMFAGEFGCLIIYIIITCSKSKQQSVDTSTVQFQDSLSPAAEPDRHSRHTWRAGLAFLLPACLDALATTLLNLGLYYTFASTFQMLRGTLVLFAGLLTVVILKRRLHSHHWLGMVLITAGAAIVGAASVAFQGHPSHTNHPHSLLLLLNEGGSHSSHPSAHDQARDRLRGNLFVILAQLFAAAQFIVEEKFLKGYRVPTLLAVGLEGMWGLVICAIALPALTLIKGPGGEPLEDARAAWRQIMASTELQISVVVSVVSIAAFNYFGIKVTKRLSGAARATIDACRTLFVWVFAVLVGWERLHALQIVGFVVLIAGTSVYNELLRTCLPDERERRRRQLREPLLHEGALTWTHQSPAAAIPVPGWGRPPLPPTAPRQSRPRNIDSSYTMARSMRIAPGVFSPHSMASGLEGTAANDSTADLQTLPDMQDTQSGAGTAEAAADELPDLAPGSLGNMPSPFCMPPAARQHSQLGSP